MYLTFITIVISVLVQRGSLTAIPVTPYNLWDCVPCSDGSACVYLHKFCDGSRDCHNGEDERTDVCKAMPCPAVMEFKAYQSGNHKNIKCNDMIQCYPDNGLCDGHNSCNDGTDENESFCKGYQCPQTKVKCQDGLQCIHQYSMCIGDAAQCDDGSDELETYCQKHKCGKGFAKCKNGICIHESSMCDGRTDCTDGSDEIEDFCIDYKCSEGLFKCPGTVTCVDDSYFHGNAEFDVSVEEICRNR
ncbi:low-density lipoprotein receptor-like [Mytilus edulis]|uniref:low-density lipoprotein receptor-like n=1 Tax=Mytilus edulis TaxID=6550 RepID=UPI0039F11ADB